MHRATQHTGSTAQSVPEVPLAQVKGLVLSCSFNLKTETNLESAVRDHPGWVVGGHLLET